MRAGTVYIVGAGPGDPELITVKALRLIQTCDVIVYDRLVNEELLTCARSDAILVYCGKAPGCHTMHQESIHHVLAEHAFAGKNVLRLKGGDPLIFGRGGEEALAMAELGIPYKIVPGITSALGAASASDIPLTHRGLSASVAFVTGNRCHQAQDPVRWDLLAHAVDTLVVYMGISQLTFIRSTLLAHGKNEATPVAIIERGSTDRQRVIVGTLKNIEALAAARDVTNPALIVIGESVRVREQLELLAVQSIAKSS